jgi:hypothetical protein
VAQVTRLCLNECLGAYAARIGRTPDEARDVWRAEGLRLLHVTDTRAYALALAMRGGLCRIAPGVPVPTRAVTWSEDVP